MDQPVPMHEDDSAGLLDTCIKWAPEHDDRLHPSTYSRPAPNLLLELHGHGTRLPSKARTRPHVLRSVEWGDRGDTTLIDRYIPSPDLRVEDEDTRRADNHVIDVPPTAC